MAEFLFEDMTGGWTDMYGGGLFWKKGETYKNSIANNLFTLLALRLNAHVPEKRIVDQTYLEWAEKTWKWYLKTGMLNTKHWIIEDGLQQNGKPNRNQHWTYNQGVAIAVLVEWYQITGDKKTLDVAQKIADSVMLRMTDKNGILKEINEPHTGADGYQFKGVFTRHLYSLYEVTRRDDYRRFLMKNNDAIWSNRCSETGGFGVVWGGEGTTFNAATQSCALDTLVSLMGIEKLDFSLNVRKE